MKRLDTFYCVTGKSRLTGERVVISSKSLSKEHADALLKKWQDKPAYKRVYTFMKVEAVTNK